jgi:predicted RND superfamily exporter protein
MRAQHYVTWVARHARGLVAAHLVVLGLSIYLVAAHLPLLADFAYLLPGDAPAVRDLRRIEGRVTSADALVVVVQAPTPSARADAVRELAAAIRALPASLIEQVEDDDVTVRDFVRANRHLYVPFDELVRGRDTLRREIDAATLAANPLYIDLADPAPTDAADDLAALRDKRREAEARLDRSGHVSADGLVAMLEVRIAFGSTDIERGHQMLDGLGAIRARVMAAHPGVSIGFAGGIVTTLVEQAAITRGMILSSLVTAVLVAFVIALYFRSARLLMLLVLTLVIATTASFGAAALTVGHLNAATAFLGAIIAGNGVNYGILLIARYLEERGAHDVEDALARAIAGTLKPTAVAALGASIAYGSLAATSFKGFADFAVIGAVGMIVCWLATYLLLPALIVRWARTTRTRAEHAWLGRLLVRAIGFRRPAVVLAVAGVVIAGASVVVARYVAADPFEYDMKRLRSEGADAETARRWMKLSDDKLGRSFAGPIYIAAERADQVPHIVRALAARDPDHEVIGPVRSIVDAIPERQPEKLALLDEIRTMIDASLDDLDDPEMLAELRELRPPDGLRAVTFERLPAMIQQRLVEKDGRRGLLVAVQTAKQPDEWDGRELIRFASAVRRIELPGGETVTTSGPSVIFADIVETVAHDGPRVTLIAGCLLLVMVVALVGFTRRALAVIAATVTGSLLMVATCALLGIKVNFLDFVALPITLGLGIDYAINLAHRHVADPVAALRTTGASVLVCSLTTIIGYGSLLVSDNLAIRGFGTASLIGEITCVLTALILVPALLASARR